MIYNVKVKYFPDGLKQFYLYSHPVETGFERDPVQKKRIESAHSKSVSKSRSKVNAYDLALANHWDWFFTGTFDPERYDSYDYDVFSSCVKLFTQQLRDRGLSYLLVPEKHKSGRWHFHALIQGDIPRSPAFNPHSGERLFDHSGREIFNVPIFRYGFTTATAVGDSRQSAGYVCKYLTKSQDDVPKHKKRYWASRSLIRPTVEYLVHDDIESTFIAMKDSCDYFKETKTDDYGDFLFAEKH